MSSVAAVDAALALSSDDRSFTTPQPVADTCQTSETKLDCLLKRRLQLHATENRIRIAVEDLIMKYRTEEQLTDGTGAGHGMCRTETKYCCYSASCVTRDASHLPGPCYSLLCRRTQEQAFSCKICIPEKLQQDLCRLSYTVPNTHTDDNESPISQNPSSENPFGLDKSNDTVNDTGISSSCVHVKQKMDEEQSTASVVSTDGTNLYDTTKQLRLLTDLLQRHISNGHIHLTEVLVSRLQSLLDTDSRNPVYLRGTIHNLCQKKTEIPVAHDFRTRSRRQSVFILPQSNLSHLARSGGIVVTIPGFSSNVSMRTDSGWIYASPRPLFSTAWRYRTASARNLSAIALQLRVLWCCIRWDDMSTDISPLEDMTVASETGTFTTTILRRRDVGQDGLRSEYLVRRVTALAAPDDDWHGN